MRRLALWIPDWPLACLALDLPPGVPGAIARGGRIECASMRARARGVRAGMRESTAQYLCPDLVLLPRDEDREGRTFERVLGAFDSVAAGVVCERPGRAWAPALPASRWHGGEERAARALVEAVLEATAAECFVGIAEGPVAAAAAARASRIIPAEATSDFLGPLPLAECLPFLPPRLREEGARSIELLASLGVVDCAGLLALGRGSLLARFGAIAAPLHDLASAREVALRARERAEPDRSIEIEIDEEAGSLDLILLPVRAGAVRLAEDLRGAGLSSQVLEIAIEAGEGNGRVRTWSGVDVGDPEAVVERARWQLKGWADLLGGEEGPRGPARRIILSARSPVPGGLAAPLWGSDADAAGVERVAERLHSLFGEEGVRVPHLQGGFDPRTRVELLPWSDQGRVLVPRRGEWEGALDLAPPTLFDHPLPVELLGGEGLLEAVRTTERGLLSCTPKRIRRVEGASGTDSHRLLGDSRGMRVELLEGPWAIRGRWWEADEARGARVYLRLRPAKGADLLLVGKGEGWWIEGLFA